MNENWTAMSSDSLPVDDCTITIVNGEDSAVFTFWVHEQPMSTRPFARLGKTFDRFTLSYIVEDGTDYTAEDNPRAVFGSQFGTMLIKALRALVWDSGSAIPKPGAFVTFGSSAGSIVTSIEIAQIAEKTSDCFLVTCNVEEDSSYASLVTDDSPKLAKSEEVAPWEMPAEVLFDARTTEGLTLGFAYPTKDLDGSKLYPIGELLSSSLAAGQSLTAVANYAGDPFASPPAFPKAEGTLKVSKAFLRDVGLVDVGALNGVVNDNDVTVKINGASLVFPTGTLSPVSLNVSPKLYKNPIPWYPKTKHPLNKTYGELFWGYSKGTANKIAVNKTDQIIVVHNPVYYIEMSASFSYRPEGFGVWVANRGYMEKDDKAAGGLSPIPDGRGSTVEAWLDKNGKKTDTTKIWRGFTTVKQSSDVSDTLELFFDVIEEDVFSWATSDDGYGGSAE